MTALNFNAQEHEPQADFEAIPAGKYVAMITESEMKPTKNGSGQYLQLSLKIIDGPYKNRILFDRLNLVNQNQTAVEIAQRSLSAICHAIGVLQVKDSHQLHNKPLEIRVKYKAAQGDYEPSNEIGGYKSVGASQSYENQEAAPPPSAMAQQSQEKAPPPWARK